MTPNQLRQQMCWPQRSRSSSGRRRWIGSIDRSIRTLDTVSYSSLRRRNTRSNTYRPSRYRRSSPSSVEAQPRVHNWPLGHRLIITTQLQNSSSGRVTSCACRPALCPRAGSRCTPPAGCRRAATILATFNGATRRVHKSPGRASRSAQPQPPLRQQPPGGI